MMTTNQNRALRKAHGQPSASTRPPSARRRTGVRGTGREVCAIAQLPAVMVPVMFGWTVQM